MQEIRYAADEAAAARTTIEHANQSKGPAGVFVSTQGAGAIWRVMHVVDEPEGGLLVRLEPVDPHDVPIGQSVYQMPLARPQTLL